jgi:hypothetical protein
LKYLTILRIRKYIGAGLLLFAVMNGKGAASTVSGHRIVDYDAWMRPSVVALTTSAAMVRFPEAI